MATQKVHEKRDVRQHVTNHIADQADAARHLVAEARELIAA